MMTVIQLQGVSPSALSKSPIQMMIVTSLKVVASLETEKCASHCGNDLQPIAVGRVVISAKIF